MTTANDFDMQLSILKKFFRVMRLTDALALLREKNLPDRAVAITFDDGYSDNATVALPILRKYGLSATFFIATDYVDGSNMWNDVIIEAIRGTSRPSINVNGISDRKIHLHTVQDKQAAISHLIPLCKHLDGQDRNKVVADIAKATGGFVQDTLMLSESQLKTLDASGMDIGAHTRSHPILAKQSDKEAQDEIVGSRKVLESLLSANIDLFAYPNGVPNGDFTQRHAKMVEAAGFSAAVTTAPGAARANSDFFQLPRQGVWDRNSVKFVLRMFHRFSVKQTVWAA